MGTGNGNWVLLDRPTQNYIYLEPTNVFAFYYRRYFNGGGDGRIWLGLSGNGDGLVGGEIRVPMGKRLGTSETASTILFPSKAAAAGTVERRIVGRDHRPRLVHRPPRPAAEKYHPYRPMLERGGQYAVYDEYVTCRNTP